MKKFSGSICIRQRIAASYRRTFFELVAERCEGKVTVIAGQPDQSIGEGVHEFEQLSNADLIRVPTQYRGSGVLYRYYQPGLEEHLSRLKPDVFVSEASPRFVDTQPIIRHIRKQQGVVLGWGAGTTDFWDKPFKQLRKWYRNRNLQNFDGMLCYSSIASKQYQEIGYSNDQTFVLYNSTLPRPASAQPPIREPFRSPAKVLFIGRLVRTKNIDRLISAAMILKEEGVQISVQIVGNGPDIERLKGLAEDGNAPVQFLGEKTGSELSMISQSADLFVLPGLGGLAIQEAMANGLPVIVTQADGTELDLVKNNGWISAEDTQALAQCIKTAISDPEELRRRGRESYRIVFEEINLDLMADRFVDAASTVHKRLGKS